MNVDVQELLMEMNIMEFIWLQYFLNETQFSVPNPR